MEEKMKNIAEAGKTFAIIIAVYVVTYAIMYVFSMLVFGLVTLIFDHSGEIMTKCKNLLQKMQDQVKLQINRVCNKTKKYVTPDSRDGGIWYNWR